jgi:hypothetical protein
MGLPSNGFGACNEMKKLDDVFEKLFFRCAGTATLSVVASDP